jgi:hypothetical protein
MFNRVKFVINKILFQTSKNKKGFTKNKKIYNITNFNNKSIRKFSTFKPQNDPPNLWFIIVTVCCGSLFIFKNKYK